MATIKDIANAAGVSVATVSHVVNNTRFVSPELRKRVEEAIAHAETPPNFVVKKQLQEQKKQEERELEQEQVQILKKGSDTVILPMPSGPDYYILLTTTPCTHFDLAIEKELCLLTTENETELIRYCADSEGKIELLEKMLSVASNLKGIFLISDVPDHKLINILDHCDVPKVVIGNSIEGMKCDRVNTANEDGAYKATTHLIRSGHENIAILCGSEEREFNRERIEGYKRALRDNNLSIQERYIVDDLKGKLSVKIAMDKLRNDIDKPSALFVANLDTIYHVYHYISEHEINCPKELSVVCFNDFPWATLITPQTTTVRQDTEMIAREAFSCMKKRIREAVSGKGKSEDPKTILVPTQLCVRQSTCGIGRGPFGERAVDISELSLNEEEKEECRRHNYTAAISFHYSGRSWSLLQEKGIRNIFDKLNVQIIAVVDAHFNPELQTKQIRSLKMLEPDILISIPTDAKITAEAYHEIAEGNTKLVFMSNIPDGFNANDYVSCVSVNERSHGRNIGRGIGEYLKKMRMNNVGMICHKSDDFYATRQRDSAGEQILQEEYPEMNICSVKKFIKDTEAYDLTKQMIKEHPEIEGIYVSWDAPAKYVLNALSDLGREDIAVSTGDLEYNIALNMAKGGNIKALSAQMPYEQGEAVAMVAVKALMNEVVPSYVGVEPVYVDRYNLQKIWQKSYKEPLPEEIKQALNWTCLNEI